MKKWIVVIVLAVLAGGCVPTADQIRGVGDDVGNLSILIDNLQAAVSESQMVESEKLNKINKEIDRIQPTVQEIANAMQEANYVDGDDIGNAIVAAQAVNAASAPVNPYAVPIGAGLTLAGLILEILRRKEKNEKETAEAKYAAHKQGAEAFRMRANKEVAVELYESIGKARERIGVS